MHSHTLLTTQSLSFGPSIADASPRRNIISLFFDAFHGATSHTSSHTTSNTRFKRNFKKNKFFFIPLAIIVVLIVIGVVNVVNAKPGSPAAAIAGAKDQKIELQKPLVEQVINKNFSFPLKDAAGKEVSKIQFTIEKAELRNDIIVKGQKATSVKGRSFLILPIKIKNDYNAAVQINARDYVRLIINNNTSDKLAADIHNDPVEVQAISTKQTRLGFPIDDTVTKVVLQVGEIKGDKQDITIDLKK